MTDNFLPPPNLTFYVAEIVAAYTSNNEVKTSELLELIKAVHVALVGLGGQAAPASEPLVPAVPIKKSVFPDHIVCLEDGRSFKTIKRHLEKEHGMTLQQYGERWGLPATYPMVSPNHAGVRSALAKEIGLGRKLNTQKAAAENEASVEAEPLIQQAPAGKRGRPRKATPDPTSES